MFKLFFNRSFNKLYKEAILIIDSLGKDNEIYPTEIRPIALVKLQRFAETSRLNHNQLNLAIELALYKYNISTTFKKP